MKYEDPPIYPADHPCSIPYEIRDQHVYIPGKTRHGKTTMLHRLIMGDILNGGGVTVLDPKGDLIADLLNTIPAQRKDNCICIDLSTPIPLDIMDYNSDGGEKEALVGELKYIIEGDDSNLKTADALLEDLLYSLLAIPDTTFLDVYRFFQHENRRNEILQELRQCDPELWGRWQQFPKEKEWQPIATRINKFWRNPSLRAILGTPKPKLNISEVMDTRKILLVDLGGAGEAKTIYGSLLVAKFQQATRRRHKVPAFKRVPHFLYVDEFEYFQTKTFAEIFSIAGGLGLRLTVGNQFIGQLHEDVRRSIFGNAGTFISLKIGEDTNVFKNVVYPYDHNKLAQLKKYQAMYKIGDADPIFKWTRPAPEKLPRNYAEYIRKRTVEKYGCDSKADVVSLRHGIRSDTQEEKPDAEPSGPPQLPPYRRKEKRP